MKILKIWKGGKNSEDISKSGNFSRKKHCCYNNAFYTFIQKFEYCWHGKWNLLLKNEFLYKTWYWTPSKELFETNAQ